MKSTSLLAGALLIFGAFCATSSNAATAVYSSSVAFNAAVTGTIVDDYENAGYGFLQSDAAMTAVVGETSYTSTGFNNLNIVQDLGGGQHNYCAGCNGSFRLGFLSTSISNANGVGGVGADYFYNSSPPFYTAFVTFGDGSTSDYALNTSGSGGYFGITSDLGIKSIDFGPSGGTTTGGSFAIDNLAIGTAGVVPEPATWAMMIMGFGAAGSMIRRRKTVVA